MAANNTDLLRKGARKWVGQIGSGGVADAAVTTIPLSSATGLPTDTAIDVVIGRVDSAGTLTASLEETVTGVVSGTNLVTCVRGEEGTAQSHLAGAVVEVLLTNNMWGDVLDAFLAEHGQLGAHSADAINAITEIAAALKSGSDATLITGTKGTSTYLPKWNADGDLVEGFEMLDEDSMATNSATKLSSQQSIKAYIDAQVATQLADIVEDLSPQLGANLDMNEFQITEDTNAKLRMQYVSALADNGVVALDGQGVQIMFIVHDSGHAALFEIRGGFGDVDLMLSEASEYTATKDTDTKTNVYYDTGYKIQNMTGAARNYTIATFGIS